MSATRAKTKEVRHALSDAFLDARAHALTKDGARVSYYSIARGTGLHVTYVCRIFNKRRTFSVTTAEKIAGYLGLSVDRFLALFRK